MLLYAWGYSGLSFLQYCKLANKDVTSKIFLLAVSVLVILLIIVVEEMQAMKIKLQTNFVHHFISVHVTSKKTKTINDESITIHYGCRSFRIQVDLHTSRSFRRHDLGRFACIKVISPTIWIADINVYSHTQFESIRIQKMSFAYVSKFEVISLKVAYYAHHDFLSEYYSRWWKMVKQLLKSKNKFQQA